MENEITSSVNKHIITQNKDYFLSNLISIISLKKETFKKLKRQNKGLEKIFLYDFNKEKLYGPYTIDLNMHYESDDKNYENVYIKHENKRRGIYFNDGRKYSDFSIYDININAYEKFKERLYVLNSPMSQTFLSCSIKKDIFEYNAIETYPSLYIVKYKKHFDRKAYISIYKEYKRLIDRSNSENIFIERYIEIGGALMNMLMPEKDFREHIIKNFRILYLYLDFETSFIPWDIFSYNGRFLSENIIFSFTHTKNILFNPKTKIKKPNMAIISIPHDDIKCALKEIDILIKNSGINIDVYTKPHNYFEFIKTLEDYDIVHIITHGQDNGIVLSEEYVLEAVGALENPPSLVFINACNMENTRNRFIESLLYSGVNSVIAGLGSLSDSSYMNFVEHFYNNLLHKNSRINTAQAYYFASIESREKYRGFLRYRFYGVPTYV